MTRRIRRAYRTELDPNRSQVQSFLRHAGCARFIYNWGLTQKIEAYKATGKSPSCMTLNKELTLLKRSDCPWLYEVSNKVLQNALRNLDAAYANFFRGCAGNGASGFPRYKSKKRGLGSFKFNGSIIVEGRRIKLPIVGWVSLKEADYLPRTGVRITSATVSEQAGRWYVSLQVEEDIEDVAHNSDVVGIDLGCNHLATLSDGTVYENPKPLKRSLRKLKRTQRTLSRRQKGSANRQKARRRVARIHQRVGNIRKNALHQTTTAIVKRYGVVVMEDLNVAGMVKNHTLARTINDVGMAEFKRQMAYKLDWAGGQLILADRFFPSSKNCSECGAYKGTLTLSERTYCCESCGVAIDRDLNAARNLAMVAGKSPETQNACGATVRLESFEHVALKQEPTRKGDWWLGALYSPQHRIVHVRSGE